MTTENQQINNQKLIDFAQAVGADIKRLNEQLGALPQSTQITEQLTEMRREIDAIKSTSNVDYLAIYRRAKGEEI